MELDFSFMDGAPAADPGPKAELDPGSRQLQRQADKNAAKIDFALEAWRGYQDAIKATDALQNDILKGLQAGAPLEPILLQALKAVALATNCEPFYIQAKQALEQNYQEGKE